MTLSDDHSFSALEERRRTFWVAFCLDRFLCSRNEYPLTLQEEQIGTRLPCPESNFQNNQPVRTRFLSEAIMSAAQAVHSQAPLSPFAECVVLATLHGRVMTHARSHAREPSHDDDGGGGGGDFWMRQARLAATVEARVQLLGAAAHGHTGPENEALLLFGHMLGHSAVVKLGATAAAHQHHQHHQQHHQQHQHHHQQAADAAAAAMVRLARQMPSFGCLRAHPFLPDPLACAAGHLLASGAGVEGVQHLLRVLKDMQGMNSLARAYLTTGPR